LTPERFADILCEDLHLPPAQFVDAIVASIREQLEEYHLYAPNAHMKEPEENKAAEVVVEQPNGVTTDSDQVMSEATEPTASESLTTQTEPAPSTSTEEELRIIIKVSQPTKHVPSYVEVAC
jgi:hypothetical protein